MIFEPTYQNTSQARALPHVGAAALVFCAGLTLANGTTAQANGSGGSGYDPYNELIKETVARREFIRQDNIQKLRGATTVDDQSRKFAAPDGLKLGPFLAHPSIGVLSTYDDNLFRSNTNKQSDLRTVFSPHISLHSDMPRHQLDMSLGGRIVTFRDNSDQNYEDYNAMLRGALHFDHAHTISAAVISGLGHEERGGLTAPLDAAEPVPVFNHRASIGITRDVGRLYGTLAAHAERIDFKDVKANNGTTIDQDFRDVDSVGAGLQVGYRISPGFSLIGSANAKRLENKGTGVNDFDGNHFDIRGGVGFELGPLINVDLMAGYGFRDYDAAGKDAIGTAIFGGEVEWLPTRRATVRGKVSRSISDSPDANGDSFVSTKFGAELDYEIYHNIVAHGGLTYTISDFSQSGREDNAFSASVGVDYLYSKNIHFSAGYQFVERSSTDPSYDSTNNRFTVGAKLQF